MTPLDILSFGLSDKTEENETRVSAAPHVKVWTEGQQTQYMLSENPVALKLCKRVFL